MLTNAMGLDMSLLLLTSHHSYPEGKANHMRVITKKTISYPSSNYHSLDICNVLVTFDRLYYTWPCCSRFTDELSEVHKGRVMCPRPPTY